MGKRLDFTKEDKQVSPAHVKGFSTSLVTGEMQIETTTRYHFTATRMADMETVPQCMLMRVWAAHMLLAACQVVSWGHRQFL